MPLELHPLRRLALAGLALLLIALPAAAFAAAMPLQPTLDDALIRQALAGQPATVSALYQRCVQGDGASCGQAGDAVLGRSPQAAAQLWERSCWSGSALACAAVGDAYRLGRGVPQVDADALDFYHKACDMGELRACRLIPEVQLTMARAGTLPVTPPPAPRPTTTAQPAPLLASTAILPGATPQGGETYAAACQVTATPGGPRSRLGLAYTDRQCAAAIYHALGDRCPAVGETWEAIFFNRLNQKMTFTSTSAVTTRYGRAKRTFKTGLPCYAAAEARMTDVPSGDKLAPALMAMLKERTEEKPMTMPEMSNCSARYDYRGNYSGTYCDRNPYAMAGNNDLYFVKNIGKSTISFNLICTGQLGDWGNFTLRPGEETQVHNLYQNGEGSCVYVYP